MVIDARSVDDGSMFEFDLAVVGAGPAGISLVDRLRDSGLSIALIEGGGVHPELKTQRLYHGDTVGDDYFALDACRYRLFGGTSNHWGGWCRPLDPIDFEQRDWIPGSGWPITRADLDPYYASAAQLLELSTPDFTVARWERHMPPSLPISDVEFENAIVQYSPPTNFGDEYGPRIASSPHVTTLLHANVTEALLDDTGERIHELRVATLTGRSLTIRARVVVLATGGIENARLLLASRSRRPAGLGNEHDLVGRYFAEHLHCGAGHIASASPDSPISRDFYRKAMYDGSRVRGVLTPTETALLKHRCESCMIAVEGWSHAYHGTPFLGWSPFVTTFPVTGYRRLRQNHQPLADRLKSVAEQAWSGTRRIKYGRAELNARLRGLMPGAGRPDAALYFRTEQLPDRENRVLIGRDRDALGMPRARLAWKIGESSIRSIETWLGALDVELRTAGVGRVVLPADGWQAGIIGGPHHLGATRMASSDRAGVVDADCRVHSVKNLYIAGSSVFTTGGYANPTFTIVALALRLADHIKRVLRS
jgi:choline dehydrogenase-like flavoprotein